METGEIIIEKFESNFTQIHNSVLRDENLTWQAKGLLVYLLSHSENYRILQKNLYKVCKSGQTATTRAFHELIDEGYIQRIEILDNGRRKGYNYIVFRGRKSEDNTNLVDKIKNRNKKFNSTDNQRELDNQISDSRKLDNPILDNPTNKNIEGKNTEVKEVLNKFNTKKEKGSSTKKADMEERFEKFWSSYHSHTGKRKTDKDATWKHYKKLNIQEENKAIENIQAFIKNENVTDKRFLPKARTYISDKRFNDEFEVAPNLTPTPIKHIPEKERRVSMEVREGYENLPRQEWTRGELAKHYSK